MNRLGLMPMADLIETGATPPSNSAVIWYDTTTEQLKKYNASTEMWEPVKRKDLL